jgi:DNA-binding MarR family transcriptional regulator
MSLEEEIKQDKFRSEYQKAAVNLLYTGNWLYSINAAFLKTYQITPEQFNVLRILRGSYPQSLMLMEISSRMLDKNSNCTRLVEKLKQKGFLFREINDTSRRQVDIRITEKGLSLLSKIDAEGPAWIKTMKTITRLEAQELNRILDKLRS